MAVENGEKVPTARSTSGNSPTNAAPPSSLSSVLSTNNAIQQTAAILATSLVSPLTFVSSSAATTSITHSPAGTLRDDYQQLNFSSHHHHHHHNHQHVPSSPPQYNHSMGLALPQQVDEGAGAPMPVTSSASSIFSGIRGGGGVDGNRVVASFNGNCTSSISNGSNTGAIALMGNGNGILMSNNNHISAALSAIATPAATVNHCNKSETSSNASVNGSIKKVSSSNAFMNSREDVTSLGGASSINSQSTTHNNSKGTKDNSILNFYNGSTASRNTDNDEDDGLGPLPSKWETAYTERGELYFIDHNTGTSHWLDPRLSKFQKKSLEDCGDNELPYGWEKIEDALYGTYFIDHVNRRTQYENPVLEAKRRAAEQKQNQQQQSFGNDLTVAGEGRGVAGVGAVGNCIDGPPKPALPYKFTRNPAEMQGERITTTLLKSSRGLGITIVGGDDNVEEFLQIKSIVPNGPAWLDGQLQTGDILVYVNDTCVLGFTHHEMVNVFQSILPGETVTLEVCRGYPLPFDPNDPNTEVVTTIAVDGISADPEKSRILMDLNMDGNYNFLDISDATAGCGGSSGSGSGSKTNITHKNLQENFQVSNESKNEGFIASQNPVDGGDFVFLKKPEILSLSISKGVMGFGFTIADSAYGQKVKKILDPNCCTNLQEGDILLEINNLTVRSMSHCDVVQVLKECSKTEPTTVKIQRGNYFHSTGNVAASSIGAVAGAGGRVGGGCNKLRKNVVASKELIGGSGGLFRSKTPTADLYSTQQKEILPIRPKTPLVDTRRTRVKTPSNELNEEVEAVTSGLEKNSTVVGCDNSKSIAADAKSTNSLQEIDSINNDIPFMDPFPKLVTSLSERLAEASMINDSHHMGVGGVGVGDGVGGGGAVGSYQYPMDIGAAGASSGRFGSYDNALSHEYVSSDGGYNSLYGNSQQQPHHSHNPNGLYSPPMPIMAPVPTYHQETCYCYECQDYQRYKLHHQQEQQKQQQHHQKHPPNYIHHQQHAQAHMHAHAQKGRIQNRVNELMNDRRKAGGFSPLESHHPQANYIQSAAAMPPRMWNYTLHHPVEGQGAHSSSVMRHMDNFQDTYEISEVLLERQALGFGFRIVGGTEEGSQVTVGHIVPGGAADNDPRVATGDEILSIDGVSVVNASHHKVVSLMGEAALRGQVMMVLRRRLNNTGQVVHRTVYYPYDVIVSRHENEGFGFVIISSVNQYYGSTIGKLISGSPADRCGELKVGDRIVAVNRIDIAGMSHGDVVNLIKESGLHVRLTIGCPKEGNPIMNPSQSSPGMAPQHQPSLQQPTQKASQQLKSDNSYYFDRSHLSQHPQL